MNANNTLEDALEALRLYAEPENLSMMSGFGIDASNAIGVRMPDIRKVAKMLKTNHALGWQLYQTGIHEAMILGCIIMDPQKLTEVEFDYIVSCFNSWDLCDQACGGILIKSKFATIKVFEYVHHEREYTRRAGFVLMTYHFIKTKKYDDTHVLEFLNFTEQYAFDSRNFVKKAVNWALRQIGKSNSFKHYQITVDTALRIKEQPHSSSKWIANDALRELYHKKS